MTEKDLIDETDNSAKETLPVSYFLGIKVVRYRIVTDKYLGYECRKWRIWFPFWIQMGFTNTHRTIGEAIQYIEKDFKNDSVVLTS